MNTALWIVQCLAGFAFFAAGAMKLSQPKEKLAPKMSWMNAFSAGTIKLIAIAEVLGGIGLIVPAATKIMPILTPIAAAALVLLMLGAFATHLRLKEALEGVPSLVLAAMAAFVAYGRFVLAPL